MWGIQQRIRAVAFFVLAVPLISGIIVWAYAESLQANESPEAVRLQIMKDVGSSMKQLSRLNLQSDDAAQRVLSLAETLGKGAGKQFTNLFPEGSTSKGTLPAVWEDFDEFKKFSEEFQSKVSILRRWGTDSLESGIALDSKERNAIAMMLGQSCRSCHRRFKKD